MKTAIVGTLIIVAVVAFSLGVTFGIVRRDTAPTTCWTVTQYAHGEATRTWKTKGEPQLLKGHWWFVDEHGGDVVVAGTVSIEACRELPLPNEPTPAKPSILVPKKPGNLWAKE